jgi:hypothetical protein
MKSNRRDLESVEYYTGVEQIILQIIDDNSSTNRCAVTELLVWNLQDCEFLVRVS